MKVILTERIRKLGDPGTEVEVRNGFARNYLIPYGKAIRANRENRARFEAMRSELEQRMQSELADARKTAEQLEGKTLEIPVRVNAEGGLYGSVGTVEIANAIHALSGASVSKNAIRLNDGALTELGQYEIVVSLHADLAVTVEVVLTEEA